ncbi:unnamed protein product, partial [Brassica rapa subsp. narinosa]
DFNETDFISVSPAKITKDGKDANVPAYGRGLRGKAKRTVTVKDEAIEDKKKAQRAEAALKRKEKQEAKKKENEEKKQNRKAAELQKKQEAGLQKKKKEDEAELPKKKKEKEAELPKKKKEEEEYKPEELSADHESDFYSILMHERPWPDKEYGWVFDNVSLY